MFNFPVAVSASDAAFQARIVDRARTLIADGYTIRIDRLASAGAFFRVYSPNATRYTVDPLLGTCTCACYQNKKICKHAVKVDWLIKESVEIEMTEEALIEWEIVETRK